MTLLLIIGATIAGFIIDDLFFKSTHSQEEREAADRDLDRMIEEEKRKSIH